MTGSQPFFQNEAKPRAEARRVPKYQMYFDAVKGEMHYNVEIDEDEALESVLSEILYELRERGDMLKGQGEPQVVWNGRALDFAVSLPAQGVRPNDVLRVSTIAANG
jgi:hypothetical protein